MFARLERLRTRVVRLVDDRRGPDGSEEAGFTIVELAVTMLVMSLVMVGAMAMFASMLTNDRYQQALVNNQEKVRFALLELGRDIRNANPINPHDDVNAYATAIEMSTGPGGGTQTHIRWQLTGSTLTRSVLSAPGGAATSTRVVLDGVDNDPSSPFLRYFDDQGAEITTIQTSGDYANCAIRVEMTVFAADDPVGSQFVEQTSAEIRNRLPGGIGC
ncbi:MAG TPA: hypothetical protein VGA13_09645 [Acidimicrobiales bacterium]